MKIAYAYALVCLLGSGSAMAQTSAMSRVIPSDDAIRKILVDRIDTARQSVGIVVGVISPEGRRIISYGALAKGDARPLNGDTVFEIGSMTKVFTSLILADMVEKKEVSLDDPVQKFLPATVKMPTRSGKQITLVDLSTHSSGLPRLPTNMTPKDGANPYADYTVDQMYAFLNGYTLPRDPGALYEYSNLGGGLLGHVLALKAGTDYETLVRQRILAPLGLKDTAITLSAALQARLAQGHSPTLTPVKNWDIPTLAGAGALRSTANDVLTFLGAEMDIGPTPLKAAMARQLSIERPTAGMANNVVALGWHVATWPGGKMIWHNGGTGGYRTMMGFNPATRTGVVVLSNTALPEDDIAGYLLIGTELAKPKPPAQHTEIALDLKTKQSFVGQYALAPTFIVTVTLEGDQLFAQATGQAKFPIFPETQTQVFYQVVDAQLSFVAGPDGKAASIVMHQGGRDVPGKRVN